MGSFRKVFEDVRKKISQLSGKKIIQKTVIVTIVGVIILIAASEFFDTGTASANNSSLPSNTTQEAITASKQTNPAGDTDVENRLSGILSKIQGAGRVEVMVTYYSGSESVPGIDVKTNDNDTQEKDKEGGSRSIKANEKENKVIYEENGNVKKPFIVKELLPQVKGVVIVADGAGDIEIKSNLINAATALLDIPAHKVQVFQRKNN
jgi:stage III sporulation protein AG